MSKNKLKVVVLGAGFAGLELTSILSEKIGENLDLTLIDKNETFFLGYSKLDVMFGFKSVKSVRFSYNYLKKTGVKFRKERIKSIDPRNKQVKTDKNKYDADVLVIALGADYDIDLTPGLREGGNEFYSFKGAEIISTILPQFTQGDVIVGVTGFPFKCPQAPSEVALLMHNYLVKKGIRKKCSIRLIVPFELPIPPSYGMSKLLLKTFNDYAIDYIPEIMVGEINPGKKIAILDDGTEIPFDLFLGIPEHCAPKVLKNSGLIFDEWIPVDKTNLKTKFDNVYALGDVTSVGTPKAGAFAEGAARTAAASIIAEFYGKEFKEAYDGKASCYLEFGEQQTGRIDVDFFSGTTPSGEHLEASGALHAEKYFEEKRRLKRWFGI
jgi:sulfide:quinone oxidoreductase